MTRKIAPVLPPADDLVKIVSDAITNFEGQANEVESAIGMLFMGHAFGWRVLYIVHSIATVRKYEGILGIVAKDVFPEETALSRRSPAFKLLVGVSNFWKAVKGINAPEGFRDKSIALR
ncbi:MAG: hypothetical protein ACRESS_03330 [Stenotrophobium sp.]